MKIYKTLIDPYNRIQVTHFVVIVILILNIILFTQETISTIIQSILIVAVLLHSKDDKKIWKDFLTMQDKLKEDTKIFDRNVIVSESDLNGKITYVNEKFCDVTGYTKDELIGQPHNILRSPNTKDMFYKELWETIQSNKTFHAVFENKKKDGSLFWTDSSISPILLNNKTIGYKAIRFDTTEQALLNEGLQSKVTAQANRFEFAINSSRDGFWDYDVENQEFYLSSGWKKRLGFDEKEELHYLDYLALIPDENRFEHHAAMHNMIDKGPHDLELIHFRIKYPLITKSGEHLIIEDDGDAFFGDGETPTRITGFHRDITETQRQQKMLESQNRMNAMGEMISNIAHQWRQPIGAINNTLNDLEFDIELEDLTQIQASQFLETSKKVKEYTAFLSQTIDDFREISSKDKVKSDFSIIKVVEEVYNIVTPAYTKHSINFQIINTQEENYAYISYRRELLQVILNILNNAQDILVQKEIINPKVSVTLTKDERNIYIIINDNGGGVPQAIMEKIFDPYFTTKHESVGTGIGLYMSKKIITTHFNGLLEVDNTKDGAEFTISLPR